MCLKIRLLSSSQSIFLLFSKILQCIWIGWKYIEEEYIFEVLVLNYQDVDTTSCDPSYYVTSHTQSLSSKLSTLHHLSAHFLQSLSMCVYVHKMIETHTNQIYQCQTKKSFSTRKLQYLVDSLIDINSSFFKRSLIKSNFDRQIRSNNTILKIGSRFFFSIKVKICVSFEINSTSVYSFVGNCR